MANNFAGMYPDRSATDPSGGFIRGLDERQSVVLGQDYTVDPRLAATGRHPFTQELVVIPRGAILTIGSTALTGTPATISIANATDKPHGIARAPYFRQDLYTMDRPVPAPRRNCQISMPYIEAVNDADGALVQGGWVKSDASGRFVKWDSSSHSPELAIGRIDVIDKRGAASPGWLSRLATDFSDWNGGMGLLFPANFTTSVTNDGNANSSSATSATMTWNGSTVTLGATPASSLKCDSTRQKFFLSHGRVNLTRAPLYIIVGGETASRDEVAGIHGWGNGYTYNVDTQLGFVYFDSVIATTVTVQATYAYEADYMAGAAQYPGIPGLTDGANSGLGVGVPAWLDQVGCVGELKISIFK